MADVIDYPAILAACQATLKQVTDLLSDPTNGLASKLPLAGGTMTGAVNVMAPTAAGNPLQLSSLPLSTTVTKALPALALGGLYSFDVDVPNATVGQCVVLNPNPTLDASLTA